MPQTATKVAPQRAATSNITKLRQDAFYGLARLCLNTHEAVAVAGKMLTNQSTWPEYAFTGNPTGKLAATRSRISQGVRRSIANRKAGAAPIEGGQVQNAPIGGVPNQPATGRRKPATRTMAAGGGAGGGGNNG